MKHFIMLCLIVCLVSLNCSSQTLYKLNSFENQKEMTLEEFKCVQDTSFFNGTYKVVKNSEKNDVIYFYDNNKKITHYTNLVSHKYDFLIGYVLGVCLMLLIFIIYIYSK